MKLVKLHVENFMSIGSIQLDLDRVGMNLILGKNVDDSRFDSNGSAKSALFEAMTWGLFGEFLRDLSAESVIRVGTDKVTVSVLVDPEDGTERVWFTRTRTKKEHIINVTTEKGAQLFPANSVKDVQPQINSWLGLDFRTFTNSVYFGKGLVKFFMASNDNERKDLLETVLQLVSFDDALERSKSLSKKCAEDIVGHNTEIAIAKALNSERTSTFGRLLGELVSAKKKKETEQPLLLDKKARKEIDKQKITDSLVRLETFIAKQKVEYDADYDRLSEHHVEETGLIDKKLVDAIAALNEKHNKEIEALRTEKELFDDQIQKAYDALEEVQDRFTDAKNRNTNELSKTKGVIQGIESERSHIRGLTENLPCKECHQNISVEHKEALIERYNQELKPLYDHIRSLEDDYEQLEKDMATQYSRPMKALKERHVKGNKTHTDILEFKQTQKRNAVDEIQRINTQEKMNSSNNFIEATRILQEDYNKKVSEWLTEKAERQLAIKTLETEIADLTRVSNELDTTQNRLNIQVEDLKKDIDKAIQQQKYAEEKIQVIQEVKAKTDFWTEGFGPRGIKSFVFESALPYLTARTNHYSSFLTGGTVTIDITPLSVVKSTGNIKEKLNVSAINSKGANVYNGNSDGERRRIDICVLLALQDLISTRASKVWNTLIFDEIFDALDKTGIEHVVDMFRTFKGKSIYIISHSEDIKKHFDTAIIVQKKDGVSTIKEIV